MASTSGASTSGAASAGSRTGLGGLPTSWVRALQYAAGAGALAIAGLGLYIYNNVDNVSEDLALVWRVIKMQRLINDIVARKEYSFIDTWNETVRQYGEKEALVFVDDGRSYTYNQVDQETNKVGQWAYKQGIGSGTVVALMMENRPEFLFTWIGLAKAGATISLINTHVSGKALVHALTVCHAEHFIVGSEVESVIVPAREKIIASNPELADRWYAQGGAIEGFQSFDKAVQGMPSSALPRSLRKGINHASTLLYIYTSGTTGNPKASVINQRKFMQGALGFQLFCNLTPSDRVYTVLPLYHSAGGVGGAGMAFVTGSTLVLRTKFSARRFWTDVKTHRCSVLQYIGELCRYLLESPPSDADQTHGARLMVGNGLRPDIWEEFVQRFSIPQIAELYAATEGNMGLINSKNKVGAVGYMAPLFSFINPIRIVKFDVDTEMPVRGNDGYCIECAPDETGELIAKIDPSKPSSTFDGYTDAAATEKKILRDVFEKGDMYFRSGDLLKKDAAGYYYFVDRIGDTFRWKGENVSTNEVASILASAPGVIEANVYGVSVPGRDGRAGMVALRVDPEKFSMEQFFKVTESDLPSYARPLFLRMMPKVTVTVTFKHQKVQLRKEGFNPAVVKEKMYFRERAQYVELTPSLYERICSGELNARL